MHEPQERRGKGPPASQRPLYRLLVRPEPGIDPDRALRWMLKSMLRGYGLRCVSLRLEPRR